MIGLIKWWPLKLHFMSQLDQRKLQKQNESNILAFAVKVLSLELRCREAKCYFFFFSFYRKKILSVQLRDLKV